MTILIILSLIWGVVGGFDWFFDSLDCITNNLNLLFENQSYWEPNFDTYEKWVQSLLEKDPSYDEDFLSKQEYLNSKYPNIDELEYYDVLNIIQFEFEENLIYN